MDLPAGKGAGVAFDLDDFESGMLRLAASRPTPWPWTTRPGPPVNKPRRAKVLVVHAPATNRCSSP